MNGGAPCQCPLRPESPVRPPAWTPTERVTFLGQAPTDPVDIASDYSSQTSQMVTTHLRVPEISMVSYPAGVIERESGNDRQPQVER